MVRFFFSFLFIPLPVTLVNFCWQIALWLIPLSSEVEPLYFSTIWESVRYFPREILQFFNPSREPLSFLRPVLNKNRVWLGSGPFAWHVCNASSAICWGCWFLDGSVPSIDVQAKTWERKKGTSSHDLICRHSPSSNSQVPEDANSHPSLFCVHFYLQILPWFKDLRKKKHLSVVRLQEIFTDTLLLCQETLSVHKSQGLQTLWGHVEGVFPLSLRYLERLNHTEGGKGMKLRSSFDTSERHRLKYAKKPETALKLRKEQLVEDLANSELCETFKRAW